MSEPAKTFLIAGLGLMVAGFLFRIAMTARRAPVLNVRPEPDWLDYPNEHESRHEQHGPVEEREELISDLIDWPEPRCIDDRNEDKLRDRQQSRLVWQGTKKPSPDLQGSFVEAARDYRPHRSLRNDYQSQPKSKPRDCHPVVANEISKPEDTLEQLKRDLDRVLRSAKVE